MPTGKMDNERSWLNRAVIPAGVIFAALAIGLILFASSPEPSRKEPEQHARLVEVVPAERGDFPARVQAWGEVLPAREVSLQPRVSGTVISVADAYDPGRQVKEGELLLRIDPTDYALAVEQRRADLARARARLQQEEGNQRVAQREFELVGGDVSAQEKALMLRKPQLQTARAEVDAAQAALEQARLDLQRTRLKAPFNALVLEATVETGAQVSSNTVVARMAGTDEYRVELSVPVTQLPWIELPRQDGTASTVRLFHDGVWGARHREGRVLRLRGDLAEPGRMARLLVTIADPLALTEERSGKPPLLLGSFLRAEILGREMEDVVPLDRAWLRAGDRVWVMNEKNELEIRDVKVLFRGSKRVYVREGIKAGERIVTSDIGVPAGGMPLRVNGDSEGENAP